MHLVWFVTMDSVLSHRLPDDALSLGVHRVSRSTAVGLPKALRSQ